MKTYLMVKQHNKTGLKYFCKTIRKDPINYIGSGGKWKQHLQKHGKDFKTVDIWEFNNTKECHKFAENFSIKNNIVKSSSWANAKIERGRDGGSDKGHKKPPRTKEHTENHRKTLIGRPNPKTAAALRGRTQPEEINQKRSAALKGKAKPPRSIEHRLNISKAKQGITLKKIMCPHCGLTGGGGAMKLWHFNNCKNIK